MINYSRLGYEIKRDFTNFSLKISKGLKRPQEKFVHQMIYGILAGNKLHLSEIARALKESITLKKTIDRLSKNLHAFDGKDSVMHNYLGLVRQQVKDDYAVMRWRIEEYFRFKKQQFEMEDLRVMSLQSIRNLNLLAMLAVGYISLTTSVHKDSIFLQK